MLVALFVVLAVATLSEQARAEVVNSTGSNTASATTVTCTLNGVGAFDVLYVAASATKAVSTVADGGDTFTSQVSATLATATVAAQTYIYSATPTSRTGTLTITVTWASSAQAIVVCYDTAGFGATKAHSSTGTGTLSNASSISPAVGSYTPTTGNLEISVFGGSVCGAPATITGPAATTGHTFLGAGVNTGTGCGPANFQFVGGSAYFLSASGSAQTDGYTATGANTAASPNTANWAEVAADFPANTVKSTSLAETNSLTVAEATATTTRDAQTIALQIHTQLAQANLQQGEGLARNAQLAQAALTPSDCLGIKVNLTNGVYIVNTGAICGAAVVAGTVLVQACNFFQLQCWAIPLMYLGMIDGFFIGVAGAFRVSEKSWLYLTFAGLTWGAIVEISLGIMTPTVPVILIVLNLAASFRLDKVVTSSIGRGER